MALTELVKWINIEFHMDLVPPVEGDYEAVEKVIDDIQALALINQ